MERIRRSIPSIFRIFLGLAFTFFGLNGFLSFLPAQIQPGPAADFLGALAATGYMFPLIKGTELVAGLLLLTNRFVPLALTLLAPVLVHIVAFHLFLDPAGMAIVLALVAIEIVLAWSYRHAFAGVLQARSVAQAPAPSSPATRRSLA